MGSAPSSAPSIDPKDTSFDAYAGDALAAGANDRSKLSVAKPADEAEVRQLLLGAVADGRLKLKTHRDRLVTYNRCFVAGELVDLLVSELQLPKRTQAVAYGQALLSSKFLCAVRGGSETVFRDEYLLLTIPEDLLKSDDPLRNKLAEVDADTVGPGWFQKPSWVPWGGRGGPVNPESRVDGDRQVVDNGHASSAADETIGQVEAPKFEEFSPIRSPEPLFSEDHITDDADPFASLYSPEVSTPDRIERAGMEGCDSPIGKQLTRSAQSSKFLEMSSSMNLSALRSQGSKVEEGEATTVSLATKELSIAGLDHIGKHIKQEVVSGKLDLAWIPIIRRMIDLAVDNVRSNIRNGDSMDIRRYIKVRCVPDSNRELTSYHSGAIFPKIVAHKRMRDEIMWPRVLILQFAVDHQRVENKMCSIDTLALQEREYLQK